MQLSEPLKWQKHPKRTPLKTYTFVHSLRSFHRRVYRVDRLMITSVVNERAQGRAGRAQKRGFGPLQRGHGLGYVRCFPPTCVRLEQRCSFRRSCYVPSEIRRASAPIRAVAAAAQRFTPASAFFEYLISMSLTNWFVHITKVPIFPSGKCFYKVVC